MRYLVIVLLALIGEKAMGYEYGWSVMKPTLIQIDAFQNERVHDPYIYPRDKELGYGANFKVDMDVLQYYDFRVFFLNDLHFNQSEVTGKIIDVGWKYSVGIPLYTRPNGTGIQLIKFHHSRHIVDEPREDMHFPSVDTIGVRFILYKD